MTSHVAIVLWTFASLCTAVFSQSLPYNPTSILLPPSSSGRNNNLAYVFLQGDSNAPQLAFLNISSTLSTSNFSLEIITSDLPFRSNDKSAFIPSISSIGEISVYAGSCARETIPELWRFTPTNTSTVGDGTWAQEGTTGSSSATSSHRANFLARGFSFSTLVEGLANQTSIYIFGGMCPTAQGTPSTWQSGASYSNRMLRLSPSSDTKYTLSVPTSRGPPIAEAGFTITGLTPSYSNGTGVMTQGQNFVLLGGHTQNAFINMSQVAIWSLPQESWSFVTIDQPSKASPNTELTVKSTVTTVDSRSGHTAVLTEDGSSIIVYGGWVGDINHAAEPQLAVLRLGTGFGGDGDWAWLVPEKQPSGNGIYGHGAVMLPGSVMMVLGGYNITTSGNSKRATSSAPAMFFNTTSMQWISNYTNPAYVAAIANKDSNNSSSSHSNAKEIGLGVGLGLGFAAILGALLVYFCYNRRMKKRREQREKNISSLSVVAANYYSPQSEVGQGGGSFPWSNGRWNGSSGSRNEPMFDSTIAVAGYENLNTGTHGLGDSGGYPPPPKQIPRKPLHSRNARGIYQPAPSFEFSNHGRANSLGTAGPIHPIYEADEEEQVARRSAEGMAVGLALGDPESSETKRYSDPFRDPMPANYSTPLPREHTMRSVSTSDAESTARSREREIREWVTDWAAADALLNSQTRSHSSAGRISPTRRAQLIQAGSISSVSAEEDSGRTASNLSEQSVAISAMTVSRSGSSSQGTRNNSLRGFITTINPFGSTILTTTVESTRVSPVFDGPGPHGPRQAPRSAGSGSSSFTTANTSFPALQAEGETLLPRPDDYYSGGEYSPTRSGHSPTRSQPEYSGSPSKSKPIGLGKGRGQGGWLGSLRRVFVGDPESGSISPDSRGYPSRENSPTRNEQGTGVAPRRTVSAGATLWRRKQGREDWEDSADHLASKGGRSNTFTGDLVTGTKIRGEEISTPVEEDEEWDIERAVQNRVVQVMFTVPKERLRVVNHDVDADRSDAGSLRSKTGSAKSVKAEPSLDAVIEKEVEAGARSDNGSETSRGKGKSKVLEMVEMMEGRNSPERR